MKVPQLTHCCCGCSLKTGSIIIGWVNLIPSVIAFILTTMNLVIGGFEYSDLHNSDLRQAIVIIVFAPLVFVSILSVGLAILLLVGVYKNRPTLVISWVVILLVVDVLRLLIVVLNVLADYIIVLELLILVFDIYSILVVYSFYREIHTTINHGLL